jgi:hypothetical protein
VSRAGIHTVEQFQSKYGTKGFCNNDMILMLRTIYDKDKHTQWSHKQLLRHILDILLGTVTTPHLNFDICGLKPMAISFEKLNTQTQSVLIATLQ